MPQTDKELCHIVCEAASRLGYRLRRMTSHVGTSFSWRAEDGSRIHGTVQPTAEEGLLAACKELLPHIANEL